MKRVLSLVLALSLVLGSIPAGFAATPTAGETLKGYGLLAGDQSGNLNEDKEITRGEMMVVLARLLGKFDEAKAYSIPSTSKDVAGHWAAAYIAFAEKEAWTSGKGNGMFDPNGKVTLQETAAFMMKALGYTVTDFSKVVEEATKLNLLKDVKTTDATKAIVRADLFTAALNTVNTPSKDSTQKLGEKLGVLKVEVSALDLKAVKAVSHNTIQVTLNKEATAVKAADLTLVDKDGKALEVKDAKLIDSKTVWFATADQTAGKIYTATVAGKSLPVTGLQKDASLPEINKENSRVQDNQTLRVVFSKEVDPRNALVAANYTFTNGITATAVKYALDADDLIDRTTVIVTTTAQEANKLYKLTVGAGVTDYYGNKVSTEDENNLFSFTGLRADTVAPRIKSVTAENGQKLVIEFTEESGMSEENALNAANYVFVDKTDSTKTVTATAAKFVYDDATKKNVIVKLTTSAQIEKHNYELTINNVTDKFGNALTANKTGFVGAALDVTGPKIDYTETLSNTSVKVIFTETVDEATATTVANYVVNNDLAVTKAEVDSTKDNVVWLTTSAQKSGTQYKLTVSNVKDEYGNAISTGNVDYFTGRAEDTVKPVIDKAAASVVDGVTYVTVTFSEAVTEATAKVAGNYYFGTDIGYAISAAKVKDTDNQYKVKVNALTEGKVYTVVVSNVTDLAGNTINYDDAKNEKQFAGKSSDDTAAPRLLTAAVIDKQTIKLTFDKAIDPADLKPADGTYTEFAKSYTVKDADGNKLDGTKISDAILYTKASNNKEISIRFAEGIFGHKDGKNTRYTITMTTTFNGVNGTAINTSYNEKTVSSTNLDPSDVKVVSATSIDRATVDVKFNQDFKFATYKPASDDVNKIDPASIVFTNVADSTDVIKGKLAAQLDADNSILRVSTEKDLTLGARYEVSFDGVKSLQTNAVDKTVLTDSFKQKSMLGVVSADLAAKFYASSNVNAAPGLVTYGNGSLPGLVTVTMSEEVDLSAVVENTNVILSKVKADGESKITLVEAGADATKVDIYFDNTDMESGKTYTITIKAGTIKDLSGKPNSEDIKLTFGVSSGTRSDVKVEGVSVSKTATGYDYITVILNKPADKLLYTSFDVAYSSGTPITVSSIKNNSGSGLTDGSYYSIVVLRTAAPIATGSSVNVTLKTSTTVISQDGAKPVKDTTASFTVPTK